MIIYAVKLFIVCVLLLKKKFLSLYFFLRVSGER